MTIQRRDEVSYRVEFFTSGCLRRWALERTATYWDGVLTLNRPVREYASKTYDRLYAVRINGEECLLPACSVGQIQNELDGDGEPVFDTIGVRFHTHGRASIRSSPCGY